jgi:hypothetical protein
MIEDEVSTTKGVDKQEQRATFMYLAQKLFSIRQDCSYCSQQMYGIHGLIIVP